VRGKFPRSTRLICAFQYEDDAEWFYNALHIRLKEFGLEVAEDKTKTMRFSRLYMEDKNSFEFLGFEFRWALVQFDCKVH
jgi:hypothetical protein